MIGLQQSKKIFDPMPILFVGDLTKSTDGAEEMKGSDDNGRPFNQEARFKGDSQTVYLGFSYRLKGANDRALQRKNEDKVQDDGAGLF